MQIKCDVKPGAFSGEVCFIIPELTPNPSYNDNDGKTYYGVCPKHYADMENQLVHVEYLGQEENTLYLSVPSIQQWEQIELDRDKWVISGEFIYLKCECKQIDYSLLNQPLSAIKTTVDSKGYSGGTCLITYFPDVSGEPAVIVVDTDAEYYKGYYGLDALNKFLILLNKEEVSLSLLEELSFTDE